jgi:adenosylcobinamide-GDP ribazoletransferase
LKPLVGAFTLLTVIPVPFVGDGNGDPDPGSGPSKFAPLFFPVVGLAIGLVMAAAFALFDLFLPVMVTAALALVLGVALTGALHVDGLADFADGVFGGRDAADRLRIMKLPDVGAFGVVAVVLVVLVDWTAISSLGALDTWVVLALAGLVSRTAPLVVMSITQYVSVQGPGQGLGHGYSGLSRAALAGATLVTLAGAFVIGGWLALGVAIAGLLTALVVGVIARRRLGGATGDVYGASVELAFAVCVIGAVAVADAGEKLEPIWVSL